MPHPTGLGTSVTGFWAPIEFWYTVVGVLLGTPNLTMTMVALSLSLSSACTSRGSEQQSSVKKDAEAVTDQARAQPDPKPVPEPQPDPSTGSAAFVHYATGIYRLEDGAWTRVFGPADRLLRGGDRAIYVVDRVGILRLEGDTYVPLRILDQDGADQPLFRVTDDVVIGSQAAVWELLFRDQAWRVERIDPDGALVRWDDPCGPSRSYPFELVVDGDGRAWIVPDQPDAPLCHKGARGDWATISQWQGEGEAREALAVAGDRKRGVWVLTEAGLLHVNADAERSRLPLLDRGHWQTEDLAVNTIGEAVVRDAACFLDLYALSPTATPPKQLGQYRGYACIEAPMILALDDQQRAWLRTSDFDFSVWLPEGNQVDIDGPLGVERQAELGELISLVVGGVGPSLDANRD